MYKRRSVIPLCSYENMVMLNYDYLVVEIDDTMLYHYVHMRLWLC
jgi:hypothetical protein